MALTTSSNKFRVITTNNTSGLATSSKFSDINSPALVVNTSEGGVFYAPGNSSTLTQLAALPGHTHSYLPLSGGTMTGAIALGGVSTNTITTNVIDSTFKELTHKNQFGYIALGPFNTSAAHIYTDMPYFYFNKGINVNGTNVSLEGHTHNYAGASTAGGAADKVVCSVATSNVDRPILVTNESNGVCYTAKAKLNYSTGNITAPTFTGNLVGNATSSSTTNSLSGLGPNTESGATRAIASLMCLDTQQASGVAPWTTGYNNAILSISRYSTSKYTSQLGFSATDLYVRHFNNEEVNKDKTWDKVLTSSNYTSYCASVGHTHSSINDSASGAATTFGYSKAGLNYADYTYLAAWNGYELRAIHKSQFAQAAHTHVINKLTIKGIDAATTYGDYMGILQSASIDAMPSGTWFNVIKILHNNSSGYYTELAQSFTGTEGLYHRRMSVGTKTPWKHVLDSANYADYCAAKSHSHTTANITDFGTHVYDATISRTKNTVLAAPNGSNGAATFRALVAADLPSHTHTDYTSYKYAGDTVDSAENYIILSLASNGTAINGGYFYGNVSFNRGGSAAWNGKTMVIVACGGQYTSNIGAYFTIGASITIAGLYKIQYNNTYYLALKIGATSSQQVRVSGVYNTTPFVIKASDATSASQVTVSNLSTPGSITAANFITSSDKRLKTNIKSLPTDSKSLELNFYEFDYVNNDNHSAGHIAQEVKEVFPELVHGNESETEHLSIDYTGLHSIQINDLIGYIKRLEKRIIELENKLS